MHPSGPSERARHAVQGFVGVTERGPAGFRGNSSEEGRKTRSRGTRWRRQSPNEPAKGCRMWCFLEGKTESQAIGRMSTEGEWGRSEKVCHGDLMMGSPESLICLWPRLDRLVRCDPGRGDRGGMCGGNRQGQEWRYAEEMKRADTTDKTMHLSELAKEFG
ncbi:hypothetical protein AUP68_01468 [Ilyonectria robusta]